MQDLNASIMATKGQGEDVLLGDAVVLTQLDKAIGWAEILPFPLPFRDSLLRHGIYGVVDDAL
jgi:hypothetical protein